MAKANGIQERKNGDGSMSYRAQFRACGLPRINRTFARKTDPKECVENTKTAILGHRRTCLPVVAARRFPHLRGGVQWR